MGFASCRVMVYVGFYFPIIRLPYSLVTSEKKDSTLLQKLQIKLTARKVQLESHTICVIMKAFEVKQRSGTHVNVDNVIESV